jgi:hypothetical protein
MSQIDLSVKGGFSRQICALSPVLRLWVGLCLLLPQSDIHQRAHLSGPPRPADHAKARIYESTASPDDMRTLQCYVQCCEGEMRVELQAAFTEATALWTQRLGRAAVLSCPGGAESRGLSGGIGPGTGSSISGRQPPWMHGCEQDPLLADIQQRAWEKKQQKDFNVRLAVMARWAAGPTAGWVRGGRDGGFPPQAVHAHEGNRAMIQDTAHC